MVSVGVMLPVWYLWVSCELCGFLGCHVTCVSPVWFLWVSCDLCESCVVSVGVI